MQFKYIWLMFIHAKQSLQTSLQINRILQTALYVTAKSGDFADQCQLICLRKLLKHFICIFRCYSFA
jgi:hypothetical protein